MPLCDPLFLEKLNWALGTRVNYYGHTIRKGSVNATIPYYTLLPISAYRPCTHVIFSNE